MMIMSTILLIILSILSSASGTGLIGTPDPLMLPSVVPGELNSSPVVSGSAVELPKAESLFDKLTAPFTFLQGGLPCLGQSSLKAGNCKDFGTCSQEGGFGDGKGLCFGQSICCVKPVKCGEISLLNNTVLANPGFPGATIQTGNCIVKLVKPFGISHIKLLIEDLELAAPDHKTGKCELDSLSVTGGVLAPEFKIAKICGLNSKAHIYIPTVIELADIFITINLADDGSIKRRWLIRAEMIEEKSPEKPPKGCAQYFFEETGLVTSFNFDVLNKTGLGNIAGIKYGICFASPKSSCVIKFKPIFFDLGGKISTHGTDVIPARISRAVPAFPVRPVAHKPALLHRPPVSRPLNGLHAPSHFPLSYYKQRPSVYRPNGRLPAQKFRLPEYHQSSFIEAQRYPYSPFLIKLPYNSFSSFLNRPMGFYPTIYNAPMKKPDVDIGKLEDKLDFKLDDKLDKLEGLANKFGLGDKLGLDSEIESNLSGVCPGQDVAIFPIPDDGSGSIHCGNEFHFGGELISSQQPYKIVVDNKGLVHGKGFAITYKLEC